MLENESVRVNKYIASCGICSRREADRLVEQGIVLIDGKIATKGDQVTKENKVLVNGELVELVEEKVVIAYYKPTGVTCTHRDQYAKRTVMDELQYPRRLTYAGRLDKDSEGLLIMTNDGSLIQEMMRGANGHEKEYEVTVTQKITEEFLERMKNGIFLHELNITTRKCEVRKLNEDTFLIILTQGLNRQIRRMCQSCGYEVKRLKRIRVVNITLKELQVGSYREVTGQELATLYKQVGM